MSTTKTDAQFTKVKLTAFETLLETKAFHPGKQCIGLLVYCCKGNVAVAVSGRECHLTPGWFLLSHASAVHQVLVSDAHSQCYLLEIGADPAGLNMADALGAASLSPFALVFQGSDGYVRFDTEENRVLLTLSELANELTNMSNHRLVDLLFEALLIKIERAVQNHGRASGFNYVAEAKQYIRENIASDLTVQKVADHVGIHRSYLMRIFRQQTRMSVNLYINRMRITQATVLLRDSDLSITEIAFRLGFNSRQNFYVAFDKIIGCSPSQYRVLHGVEDDKTRKKAKNAESKA